jgi:hypothetical protein
VRLSIVTLGHIHADEIAPLTAHCTHIEQLVLDIAPREPLSKHRAEFNRAVDAATADWILIIRERERVGDALAKEIAEAALAAKAWGFRIRSTPMYAGQPLQLVKDDGEVRLFHRRHYLRHAEDVAVQGTVIRLASPLQSITFDTSAAHEEQLAKSAAPHSWLRRVLLFGSYALQARTTDRNTLRYLWIEAGYDVGR